MSQISRPFQIAFVVVCLLAAVWFVALRGHSSGEQSSAGSTSSAAPATPAPAATSTGPTAPGVAGLSRAIDKARGAVAQSQQNAQQLQEKSAQASSSAPAQTAGGATATGTATGSASGSNPTVVVKAHKTATTKPPGAAAKVAATASMQPKVEAELKQGKVVTILFWNPKSAVDVKVRRELNALGHQLGGRIAVHDALAGQVGSFGSFTRTVQVYGTPTILIVNKSGQTTSLTGLTDVFSLKQAIAEAKSAQ